MSALDLEEAFRIIENHPELAGFAGPRDESVVQAAERHLGLQFPSMYRQFLLRLGAGHFGSSEFYGVIHKDFNRGPIPDGIWLTMKRRRQADLPPNFIVIADEGMGDDYCLEVIGPDKAPVVLFQPGIRLDQQRKELIAEDFGAFFLQEVRFQLQNQ